MKIERKDKAKISEIIDCTLVYSKIKYQGIIYSIGDNVLVQDNEYAIKIAKVAKIIPSNGIESFPYWPCIEVYQYYLKEDIIDNLSLEEGNAVSENEVFLSNETSRIFIETVVKKVTVHSLEEYTQLTDVEEEDTYFTRANYFPLLKEIKPPMSQWEKHCYCNTPFNPDLLYICCDTCGKWFHSNCFGLSKNSVNSLSKFYCFECAK